MSIGKTSVHCDQCGRKPRRRIKRPCDQCGMFICCLCLYDHTISHGADDQVSAELASYSTEQLKLELWKREMAERVCKELKR